ncbi:MAG: undecaprenyl/decaprenyl-phosphate alpha-N-acetylglucosaminyl 1-phosphate transferase [Bacteroidia bacterium]|nr:undecaprenyl/decaprenyl-phosphate alpha-N-acetylglucosaminyl 1-phosphate transferase [Bacteroidia bacterium]
MDFFTSIIPAISACLISFISIPSIIKVAQQKRLFDEPDGKRKSHSVRTPSLGGVAIFSGIIFSAFLFIDLAQLPRFTYVFAAVILLFFTGVKDDIIPLTPIKKMLAQLLASGIVVYLADIRLSSLYGFFGFHEVPYLISVGVSMFCMLVIINAFNLIDGINGLAGGIGVVVCLSFAGLFAYLGQPILSSLALIVVGALLGFLRYNLALRAKIFMGDSGALMLGLFSAIFCIRFIELNKTADSIFATAFAPVLAVAILIIPLFDTLRVFIIRTSRGKSPFCGDRNHLHHFMIDLGMPHWQASVYFYVINIFFIAMSFLLLHVPPFWVLTGILLVAFLLNLLLNHLRNRRRPTLPPLISDGPTIKVESPNSISKATLAQNGYQSNR